LNFIRLISAIPVSYLLWLSARFECNPCATGCGVESGCFLPDGYIAETAAFGLASLMSLPTDAVRQPLATATRLVTLAEIEGARARVERVARVTPLLDVSAPAGRTLLLKCENMQPAGAFKIRGAYNMVAQLSHDQRRRGVITYSSGNHGQAMALAARELGAPAVVVMPTTAPAIKVEGARAFGAEVILEGTTSADRLARANAEAAARDLTMVPPFDHEWIIAGQGTAGLEILEQRPDVSVVVVPIGGGGLVAGVAAAIKQAKPDVRVIGVEPSGAAAMKASVDAGHPVTLPSTHSIADGLMPVRPGDLTLAHVQAFVDAVITVDDPDIVKAVLWMFREVKVVAEPSGAAAVAAVLTGAVELNVPLDTNDPIVAVVSGGNIAIEKLHALCE
jgi:threonine dehydratase